MKYLSSKAKEVKVDRAVLQRKLQIIRDVLHLCSYRAEGRSQCVFFSGHIRSAQSNKLPLTSSPSKNRFTVSANFTEPVLTAGSLGV